MSDANLLFLYNKYNKYWLKKQIILPLPEQPGRKHLQER